MGDTMKVTNNLGLPAAFVEAVSTERHNRPYHVSATTLNKGTKEICLTDRHWEELETDASQNIWQIWGTAVHSILESHKDNNFHEEQFEVKLNINGRDRYITGQVDSYDMENGILYDWKTASCWKVQFNDFSDWKQQGLTYAWLLKQHGLDVKRCKFVALLKDFSYSKVGQGDYPDSPVYIYEFAVTDEELKETEDRIKLKLASIGVAECKGDDDIEPCTPEERWASEDKFAVMEKGKKRAAKLCDTREEAEALAKEKGDKFYVEERKGESRKCANYCICRNFCSFYKKMIESK